MQPSRFIALFATGTLALVGSTLVSAQPPDQPSGIQSREASRAAAQVGRDWATLHAENLAEDTLDPRASIARYKQFYEERGHLDATVAVEITSLIAQLYWQNLHDRAKALEIYAWGMQQFAGHPGMARLQQEKELVVADKRPLAEPVHLEVPGAAPAVPAPLSFNTAALPTSRLPQPIALSSLLPSPSSLLPLTVALGIGGTAPDASGLKPLRFGDLLPDNNPSATLPPTPSQGVASRMTPSSPPVIALSSLMSRSEVPSAVGWPAVAVAPLPEFKASRALGWEALPVQLLASPDNADALWQRSDLSVDDLRLLTAQASESDEAHQTVRLALGGLLARHDAEAAQSPEKWSDPVRLAVADYWASVGDERAVALYEGLLAEKERAGQAERWVPELEKLARYYQTVGQPVKGAEVMTRMEKYTTDAAQIGNGWVEAARLYRQAGEDEKAEALYRKVIETPSEWGWAKGLAIYDHTSTLISVGKYEEARKLLQTPITGQYADQIKIALTANMAWSYYLLGDFDEAQKYCLKAIAQYNSLRHPLQGEGLEAELAKSQAILDQVEDWTHEPIKCDPLHVDVLVSQNAKEPIERWVTVVAFAPTPLEATCSNPKITIQITDNWQRNSLTMELRIKVKIAAEAVNQPFESALILRSDKYPGWKLTIPIYVDSIDKEKSIEGEDEIN
jgi:tetratricopeptide (TPR) repeat protein